MRSKRDSIGGMLYEEIGDGLVRVTDGEQVGVFSWTGEWVDGARLEPALHMLVWVGGRDMPEGLRLNTHGAALSRSAGKEP
jgi:hypothetical protein